MTRNTGLGQTRTIGIDPGNIDTGISIIDDGEILYTGNWSNESFFKKICYYLVHDHCVIAMEDIRPYASMISQDIIDTCKFIGEATYRLRNEAGAILELIPRSTIKRWVFETFPDLVIPLIDKKIANRTGFDACDLSTREVIKVFKDGKRWMPRKASYPYIDDRMVTHAMRSHYQIPNRVPGKKNKHGLNNHTWQALAVATYQNDVALKHTSQEIDNAIME